MLTCGNSSWKLTFCFLVFVSWMRVSTVAKTLTMPCGGWCVMGMLFDCLLKVTYFYDKFAC